MNRPNFTARGVQRRREAGGQPAADVGRVDPLDVPRQELAVVARVEAVREAPEQVELALPALENGDEVGGLLVAEGVAVCEGPRGVVLDLRLREVRGVRGALGVEALVERFDIEPFSDFSVK